MSEECFVRPATSTSPSTSQAVIIKSFSTIVFDQQD